MSIDPLAAGAADLAALIDAELASLAADAQALRALLVQDAVVTARVLASNGLTDLLEIAGRRVAASLPPTVRPGDVLQARVTGFDGDRILLQILGTDVSAAVETHPSVNPPPSPPQPATQDDATPVATAGAPAPAPIPPPAAAARVIHVDIGPAIARANVSLPEPRPAERAAPSMRAPIEIPSEPTPIEVRVAAARAAVARSVESLLPERASPPAAAPSRFVIAPPITSRPTQPASPTQTSTAQAPRARTSGLTAYAEPVALLRALKLPVTPSNVAAATLALQRPDQLPSALATLERALPRAGDDPNVATLRALLPFVTRIDPRSPVLATQIAAYVDHVVDGAEPKIATLLAATQSAQRSEGATAAAALAPPIATAVVAERAAALSVDLKQTMLAVVANPATPESVAPALSNAVTALTAVQLHAAQTLATNPTGFEFTIPLVTQHGAANARISVNRDGAHERARVDGENVRIAFILDTAHYGTIAIDLVTVGRDVSVDLRAESALAMRAFRDALGGLTERLESLRYRVTSAQASVGVPSTFSVQTPPQGAADPNVVVDRSA